MISQGCEHVVNEAAFIYSDEYKASFSTLEKNLVLANIIAGNPLIDGRDRKTVRPIDVEVGVLAKAHGSALFTRGETQAIVVATLGNARDAQIKIGRASCRERGEIAEDASLAKSKHRTEQHIAVVG